MALHRDLTMKEWNASETIRVTSAESVSTTLPCGTYMATIKRDGKVYFEKTFVSNETNEVVITLSEPVINQKECISATLYEDASYSKVKEALGKFESIKEVNDAVSGKTGYLLVKVMDNVNMDSLSDATLSEIKIQISDNKAITLSGTNILLPCDLVIEGDIVVADSGATINGANHKVTILADGEETKISGGKLTTNHLSMIIGGEGYVSVLAEIADLEELSVACLEDGYTLNVSDVDDAWAHIEHNAQLLIQAEVSGVKQLNLYGKDVYISGEGSLEADNVSGIYGNIYLQKKEDGTLSSFGVTSTMEDMVWQIRLLLYSQLEKGEAQISASDLADSCVQGTVLAYVPSDAHSTVAEKLGFVKKVSGTDNWDDYGKKTLLDGRLYFDDGSSAIDHAWEDAYTTDEAATCVSGGRESVHCKYCDLTKNSREIPATGKHDIYDEEGNLLTEVSHCSGCGVKNIAYENISLSAKTAVYTGKPLTAEITGIDAGYYDVAGNVQTDAGTYHIVLTGKNGYDGARTILWTIKKQTLSASSLNKPVLTANCGDKLSDVSLSGTGFVWVAPGEVLTAGSEAGGATVTKTAKYIPADMNNYNEVSGVALQIAVKHKWDAGSVMRKPTAANTGIMKYSCSGCGNTRTEPIPALGLPKINSKVKDEAKKATYRVTKSDLKNGTVTYLAPTNKKVTNVTIPATIRINGVSFKVTAIEKNAFKANKKLKTVTIGKNISSIGDYAFYKCTALTKITIPSKVKTIGKKAFYGCSKVTTLTIKTTKLTSQKIGSKAFAKTRKSMIVKLPKKKFASYKAILIKKGVNKKAKFKKS